MSLGDLSTFFGDSPHFCFLLLPKAFLIPAISMSHSGSPWSSFAFADGSWLSCKMDDENWIDRVKSGRIRQNFLVNSTCREVHKELR